MSTQQINRNQIRDLNFYTDTVGVYKENPIVGDYTIVTTDGTSNGDIEFVYEWDGFEWQTKSFKYNLGIRTSTSTSQGGAMSIVGKLPEIWSFDGSLFKGFYDKSQNGGEPYSLYTYYAKQLTKYDPNSEDYKFTTINLENVDYDLSIDGWNIKDNIYINFLQETGKAFNFEAKNVTTDNFNFSGSFKSCIIDTINTANSISFSVHKIFKELIVKNISTYMPNIIFNFEAEELGLIEQPIKIELSNIKSYMGESLLDQLSLGAYGYNEESELIPLEIDVTLDLIACRNINVYQCILNSINITNFDASYIQDMYLDHVTATQEMIDSFFTLLISFNLGANVTENKTINMYNLTINPSQSIQDQLTALGYTLNIE